MHIQNYRNSKRTLKYSFPDLAINIFPIRFSSCHSLIHTPFLPIYIHIFLVVISLFPQNNLRVSSHHTSF